VISVQQQTPDNDVHDNELNFMPHHMHCIDAVQAMRTIATDVAHSVVCLSVCTRLSPVSPVKRMDQSRCREDSCGPSGEYNGTARVRGDATLRQITLATFLLTEIFLERGRSVARERFFIGWADSTDGWVDSIDVDLNFLLVLYSTVGLYCLFGRLDICRQNFLDGQNTLAAHPML